MDNRDLTVVDEGARVGGFKYRDSQQAGRLRYCPVVGQFAEDIQLV